MKKDKILYLLIVLCLLVTPLNSAASSTDPDQNASDSQENFFHRQLQVQHLEGYIVLQAQVARLLDHAKAAPADFF